MAIHHVCLNRRMRPSELAILVGAALVARLVPLALRERSLGGGAWDIRILGKERLLLLGRGVASLGLHVGLHVVGRIGRVAVDGIHSWSLGLLPWCVVERLHHCPILHPPCRWVSRNLLPRKQTTRKHQKFAERTDKKKGAQNIECIEQEMRAVVHGERRTGVQISRLRIGQEHRAM